MKSEMSDGGLLTERKLATWGTYVYVLCVTVFSVTFE